MLSKYVPGMSGHGRGDRRLGRQPAAHRHRQAVHRAHAWPTRRSTRYKGQDKFTGKPVPVRTLMVLYPNRMHVVTIEGTGITKMADLKGKRVSTGSGGSATEVMAFRVIEAAGLDKDKDMKRERLGVAESVNAIKDRKIDAFFWVGGLPTAAVTDLAQHARREDQDDRPCRPGAGDEQEVRPPLRQGHHPARTSTRAWTPTTSRPR